MKQKTVKSAFKRVTITGSGKIFRRRLSSQHLVAGKSKRTRQLSGQKVEITSADSQKVKRLIPYR